MADVNAFYEPLLERATASFYRLNAFRVLDVPVRAEPKEVQRILRRREIAAKLGEEPDAGAQGPLGLERAPGEEEIKAAKDRLGRPLERFLDELFWFWPMNEQGPDEALDAARRNQTDQAVAIWEARAGADGPGQVAVHNLAVLDHLIALDQESRSTSADLDWRQRGQLAQLWLRAHARWEVVGRAEGFWTMARKRVLEIDDAQLSTAIVQQVRDTLPTALLLINAQIAHEAARTGDVTCTRRHIEIIRDVNPVEGIADLVVRRALQPTREQLKAMADNLLRQSKAEPRLANTHVREFDRDAGPLLRTVDSLLPPDDPTRAGLHDAAAEAMLDAQIAFGNETDDWAESIELLQMASARASGEAIRERIDRNADIVRKNEELGGRWETSGYKALSPEVVAALEEARAKARLQDLDGAIQGLLVLEKSIGDSLTRSLSYCLNRKGNRLHREAQAAHVGPLKRLVERIQSGGEGAVERLLGRSPDPNSSIDRNPPCPTGCGRSYSSWMTFNTPVDGIDLRVFMCTACNDEREREIALTLIPAALEYVILAAEVDPSNAAARKSRKPMEEALRKHGVAIPSTKALRKALQRDLVRGVVEPPAPQPEPVLCHFCGEGSPDTSAEIRVPLWGNRRTVDVILGTAVEFRRTVVCVPRCLRCREEHRKLPERLWEWEEQRRRATADDHFPLYAADVAARSRTLRQTRTLTDALSGMAEAAAIGSRCPHCGATVGSGWRGWLCQKCDPGALRLDGLTRGGLALTAYVAFMAIYVLQRNLGFFNGSAETGPPYDAELKTATLIAIALTSTLGLGLKGIQMLRGRRLAANRETTLGAWRSAALAEARQRIGETVPGDILERPFEEIERELEEATARLRNAESALGAAREHAATQFDAAHQRPQLPPGVGPESDYLEYVGIRKLRDQGWGFGSQPPSASGDPGSSPIDVEGLVHEGGTNTL